MEKQKTDLVYALADYKQLVIAYRSKYAELVKAVSFWKTSCLWLVVLCCLALGAALFMPGQQKQGILQSDTTAQMQADIRMFAEKLKQTEDQLLAVQKEVQNKERVIRELEKNISTASKQMVEDLLNDK